MQTQLSDLEERSTLTIDDVRLLPEDQKSLQSLSKRQRQSLEKLLFVFKVTTYGELEREIAIKLHQEIMSKTLSKANRLDSDKGTGEKLKDSLPGIKHPMSGLSVSDLKHKYADA